MSEVKANIQNLISDAQTIISEDFSQAPFVNFSRKNIRSTIHNLLTNAIKYRSPDRQPVININTSIISDQYILFQIEDNGLGIKEDDYEKVFTMYERLHDHVEGTGVGMSIVKKIIDNAGGKIDIQSEVGKGTIFKIYFKVNVLPISPVLAEE